ncbi:MAG: NUDIX domain-containing protein [Thermodesulfovibrionales bacterium]
MGTFTERIVIVDADDNCIGEEDKEKCHDGEGILHRAFLAMVFTRKGDLVLARRSREKRLWPGFWDGTVASHLFMGEEYEQASRRRLAEEIGLTAGAIRYLFKFQYKVGYEDKGTENEICAVTRIDGIDEKDLAPAPSEISEIRTIRLGDLAGEAKENDGRSGYTPWLVFAVEQMGKLCLF